MAIPIILDTDGGVDDCTALWYALTEPALDLVALTTVWGVVSAQQSARNVAKVLHAAGRADVPIAVGAGAPIGPAPTLATTELIHGADGLGDAGLPDAPLEPVDEAASALIVRMARERPGELTLVAVGPVTNVAHALRAAPELPSLLAGLVVMGGVAHPPGNALALGEFNTAADPTAASEVVLAPWPEPPLMVGLDVTHKATLGDDEYALLSEGRTDAARFLAAPLEFYRRFERMVVPDRECPVHDLLAVMAVAEPDVLDAPVLPLAIDTGGSAAWGTSVVDLRAAQFDTSSLPPDVAELAHSVFFEGKAPWRIALDVDTARFRARARALFGG